MGAVSPPLLPPGTVDVHVHLLPDRLVAAVARMLAGAGYPIIGTPEELGAEATADRLEAAGAAGYTTLLYAHRAGMARPLNAWGARFVAGRGGRCIGFAAVHQDDHDPAGVVAEAWAAGLWGVKIHAQVQEVDLADRRLDGVFAACVEAGRPALVHAGSAPQPGRFTGPDGLRRVLARHPRLRVCVAHLGMAETPAFVALARSHEHVFLDTSAVAGLAPGLLDEVAAARIPDRICYGSDLPWPGTPLEAAVNNVVSALGHLPGVWGENARRFLGTGVTVPAR
jgi:hypothetical protein